MLFDCSNLPPLPSTLNKDAGSFAASSTPRLGVWSRETLRPRSRAASLLGLGRRGRRGRKSSVSSMTIFGLLLLRPFERLSDNAEESFESLLVLVVVLLFLALRLREVVVADDDGPAISLMIDVSRVENGELAL